MLSFLTPFEQALAIHVHKHEEKEENLDRLSVCEINKVQHAKPSTNTQHVHTTDKKGAPKSEEEVGLI